MDPNTLRKDLRQFTGTEQWHRWSLLYPKFLLTDGALYLAEKAGAFWLMDLIASYQRDLLRREEWFQVWKLSIKDSQAVAACEDGNDNYLVTQAIEFTDFPLDEIKLYAIYDGENLVILLPSEY